MRGRNVIVVMGGLVLLSLLRLEFQLSLRISEPFVAPGMQAILPDQNKGVGGHGSRLGSTRTAGSGGRKQIPLDELTAAHGQREISCPPNTKPIFNSPGTNFSSHHTIPLVIHQTFKSRCVTEDVYNLSLAWKALGVPYYFHDDAAIERLILSDAYEEFPHLRLVWEHCITKPVVKTDLWRLLLLYEYGGIYADLDTKPMSFQPRVTIRKDDEMYTVADLVSRPSFHFMASMPRHPIPFLTLQQALYELLFIQDTGFYCPAVTTGKAMIAVERWSTRSTPALTHFYNTIPFTHNFNVLGPDALEKALEMFIRNHDPKQTQFRQIKGNDFTFHGMGGHTLRRHGTNFTASSIVTEFALPDKAKRYEANKMIHYRETMTRTGKSCFDIIATKYGNRPERGRLGAFFNFF